MKTLTWDFPLPRPHTGIVLGNGVQGLMAWGTDRLCLTVARAGFWDHRGATPFAARVTFRDLRRLLEAGDEAGVRAAFAQTVKPVTASRAARRRGPQLASATAYTRPCQIGGGRLELLFRGGWRPVSAALELGTGTLRVTLGRRGRTTARRAPVVTIRQAMDAELAWVESPVPFTVRTVPTWDHVGKLLAKDGVQPPRRWESATRGGFCQELPADAPLAVAWEKRRGRLCIATALGDGAADRAQALARGPGVAGAARRSGVWWRQYWRDVPRLELPDPVLQRAWDYGVYKQAGLTTPGGVAATLQGPWMEEYQLPPWSNDYHFNINAEMIYWPALGTNRLAHFGPLWKLIRGWLPLLRENAAKFFGAPDALMLPHAVDDRCGVVGSFWTGTIDHACTAWMAQMAWLHYRYSLDPAVLRDVAWPLLAGAFNGYWAMLERVRAGNTVRLSLPVSVSPEYGGAGMNAWGRDASFQLAALHFVAQTLPRAAVALGKPIDPRWARVTRDLPPYSRYTQRWGDREWARIGLWDGQDLAESHRHHSHLAAIYPFATIDPWDARHREVVFNSLRHWQSMGAGNWSGWCLPWASILCARCNLADAAVAWLHWWHDLFTNVGQGTLHDADFGGAGGLHRGSELETAPPAANHEIMQMDAAMGAVTAIMELLVQDRADTLHVLPALPRRWRELSFDGIRTPGAFLVGATVRAARVTEIRVTSLAGEPLRLAHGLGPRWRLNGQPRRGPVLQTKTRRGQQLRLACQPR